MSVARTSIIEQKPIVRIEEQSALQKVEYSIQFENTEKKLARSPAVASAYSETINQYIKKGYIRKVGDHEKKCIKVVSTAFSSDQTR